MGVVVASRRADGGFRVFVKRDVSLLTLWGAGGKKDGRGRNGAGCVKTDRREEP